MLSIDSLVDKNGIKAYRFCNADGKEWLIPTKDIKTALQLYQPSSLKGQLLKILFPHAGHLNYFRNFIHAKVQSLSLRDDIKKIALTAFNVKDINFSIFGGTPSVHQKATIQIFHGNRILGYGKVTDSNDIYKLFCHEEKLLSTLRSLGVIHIPECLFCGEVSDGEYMFIQTTTKRNNSRSPKKWTALHENFLRYLFEKTRKNVLFEESDFYNSMKELRGVLVSLPSEYSSVITPKLEHIMSDLQGKECVFSAFHADFTPWNMYIEDSHLYVFDWEYGRLTYPPMLDRYHFYIQQAMVVNHLSAAEIYNNIIRIPGFSHKEFEYYLIDIISRFVVREKGVMSDSLKQKLNIWCELLR